MRGRSNLSAVDRSDIRVRCGWLHYPLVQTFHATSVRQPISTLGSAEGAEAAVQMLRVLRGFISNFFGCSDCREHFMEMTAEDEACPLVRV